MAERKTRTFDGADSSTRIRCMDLTDLKQTPFILFDSGFAISRLVIVASRRAGFEPTVATRSSQLDFIVELVAASRGIAFLPKMVAEQWHHPACAACYLLIRRSTGTWR